MGSKVDLAVESFILPDAFKAFFLIINTINIISIIIIITIIMITYISTDIDT